MIGLDIFPTKFFEIQLDEVVAFNVLNEILRKEDEIRMISSTRQLQSSDIYATDFPYKPNDKIVELENMNLVFDIIKDNFDQYDSIFNVCNYWTAIYSKNSQHSMHDHARNALERINYSGILYLTDMGRTNFYSTNSSSFENLYYSQSKVGKILIFPNTIPHSVEPLMNETKRVIVSFNCEIRNK